MCLFCIPPFMCVCACSNSMLGVIESQHIERHKQEADGGYRGLYKGNKGSAKNKNQKRTKEIEDMKGSKENCEI